MKSQPEPEDAAVYREKIVDEVLKAMGLAQRRLMSKLLRPLFRPVASRFGRIAARADGEVPVSGISGGSRLILPDFSLRVSARGVEAIPAQGPLLMVSNHPGALDSIAILSCVPRKDIKVFISDVPFTRAFIHARDFFIYVPPDSSGRTATLRAATEHLRSGGALLIFAHGDVEPDPELGPGAGESFKDWSRSVELMLRQTPEAWLQVAIASGALMKKFARSPLLKIRKTAVKRQKLAEVLQFGQQMVFPRSVRTHVHLSFARPVRAADLPTEGLMSAVIDIARRLLGEHLRSLGVRLGECQDE